MTLVIKSDLTITNPKLGKLLVKKILTSGTLIKSTTGSINNTQTDAVYGGVPAKWTGTSSLFEYTASGIENTANSLASTTFLETEEFKNAEVSFEISKIDNVSGADVYLDLRKLKSGTDNYCVRVLITSLGSLSITNRYSGGNTTIQSKVDVKVGDKVKLQLVDNTVKLKINDALISSVQLTIASQTELNRNGNFGLAKGSTTTGKVGIKNLIISEII